jgi:hypothetical protein
VRRILTLASLTLALAAHALAQSNRGAFALDAMVAPTTGLGFAYYVTDGLSIRPWVGLGYSDYSGFHADLGGQVRYEFGRGWTLSPYLSASAQYSYSDTTPVEGPTPQGSRPYVVESSGGTFGTGAGLRYRLGESFSLFTEGRLIYATYPLADTRGGWSSFEMGDKTRGEVVFGLTYLLR